MAPKEFFGGCLTQNKFNLRRGGLCSVPTPNPTAPRARIPPFQRFFRAGGKPEPAAPKTWNFRALDPLATLGFHGKEPGTSRRIFQENPAPVFFWECLEPILSLPARLYLGTGEQPAELLLEKRTHFWDILPQKMLLPIPASPARQLQGFQAPNLCK